MCFFSIFTYFHLRMYSVHYKYTNKAIILYPYVCIYIYIIYLLYVPIYMYICIYIYAHTQHRLNITFQYLHVFFVFIRVQDIYAFIVTCTIYIDRRETRRGGRINTSRITRKFLHLGATGRICYPASCDQEKGQTRINIYVCIYKCKQYTEVLKY